MNNLLTPFMAKSLAAAGLAAGLAVAAWVLPAGAQGTPEQREACQPDAFRLCNEFIPNAQTTAACLFKKKRELSPACRTVMFGKQKVGKRTGKKRKVRRR
jgi:hypothetical protein